MKSHFFPIGYSFNYFKVISKPYHKDNKLVFDCECICGKIKPLPGYTIASKRTKSCGCLKYKLNSEWHQQGTALNNGIKICSLCKKQLTIDNFCKFKKSKDGYRPRCKRCSKNIQIKYKYGISLIEYENLIDKQRGCCGCCGKETEDFHVDHCHESGKIRGLLCFNCNTAIGKLGDSVEGVEKALNYLKGIK